MEPANINGHNQIVIYQTEYGQTQINVRLEEDTVWLSTNQMTLLFNREESNIRRHGVGRTLICHRGHSSLGRYLPYYHT